MSWLGRLLRRKQLERDLARELQFHVEAQADDLVRAGLSPEEAHRRARVELGGVEQAKEAARDARGTRWIDDLWQDGRYAFRVMLHSPIFSTAAVVTLALGIGANTAVWSIVDALMLRSLPIERAEELHAVRRDGIESGLYIISHPTMLQMRATLAEPSALAAMSSAARMYTTIDNMPEPVVAQLVSGNWFAMLGLRATRGRLIGDGDDRALGAHPVAVISYGFWRSRFGGDPAVVGRTIRLSGAPLTIIGVSQAGFSGLTVGVSVDVWVPLMMQHEVRYRANVASESSDIDKPWILHADVTWLTLVARVAPSQSRQTAARLDPPFRAALAELLAGRDSAARAYGMREHVVLDPIPRGFSSLREQFGDPLRILLASVGLILLIACGNLAGLLLARSAARNREFAVRVSLGASPGRLVRQILTESILLSVTGGLLSLAVARWGTSALLRMASSSAQAIPLAVRLDARILGFAFGVSIVTGVVFGLAPALRASRTDLYDSFKAGGRVVSAASTHRLPLGRALVTSQLALSLVLVTSAALFVQTFRNLIDIDPGYDRDRVLEARLDLRAAGYTSNQLPALNQRLLDAVRAVPGVRTASLSLHGLAGGVRRLSGFTVPDRVLPPGTNTGQENFVSPDYFTTVGIPLVRGRGFTDADRTGTPRVVIISQAFARRFFGRDDVLGARFGYGPQPDFEVIGVARDARVNSLREAAGRVVFYPLAQGPNEYVGSLEARIAGSPEAMIPAVRRAIASVDRNLPVRDIVTLGVLLERGLSIERLVARLAGVFATLALVLAGVGLYGVLAYSVSRRTNEIGVRLALGASPGGVTWSVLRDSLVTLATGLAVGAALWFPILSLTQRLVYGVSPHDPATLAVGATLLFAVGALAGLVPALRASRIDPIRAIRAE